jgi:hypothetical protein
MAVFGTTVYPKSPLPMPAPPNEIVIHEALLTGAGRSHVGELAVMVTLKLPPFAGAEPAAGLKVKAHGAVCPSTAAPAPHSHTTAHRIARPIRTHISFITINPDCTGQGFSGLASFTSASDPVIRKLPYAVL